MALKVNHGKGMQSAAANAEGWLLAHRSIASQKCASLLTDTW